MENDLFLQQAKFQRKAAVFMMIYTLQKKHFVNDDAFTCDSYFNNSDTRSGYFRLKFSDGQVPMSEQNTTQSELGLFLRAYLQAFISGNTELVKKFL